MQKLERGTTVPCDVETCLNTVIHPKRRCKDCQHKHKLALDKEWRGKNRKPQSSLPEPPTVKEIEKSGILKKPKVVREPVEKEIEE